MKTTINISDELLNEAIEKTGIKEKTKLIHFALESVIKEAHRNNLISLFGSDKKAKIIPRKRSNE